VFSLESTSSVNASGGTYVAYVFAHDAGGFGDDGTESVIKCGSFTLDGAGAATVDLGWEPQWILSKPSSTASLGDWRMGDIMRGFAAGGAGTNLNPQLYPNTSGAEEGGYFAEPTSTGFKVQTAYSGWYSQTFVYIAIRRGPMKTPEDATEVFSASTTARNTQYNVGFPTDFAISKTRSTSDPFWVGDRLRGNYGTLRTETTGAEDTGFLSWTFDAPTNYWTDIKSNSPIQYNFRRAPGFFDVVTYTGTGSARTVNHNLGVAPELLISRSRSNLSAWYVYSAALGNTSYLRVNFTGGATSDAYAWNSTTPTASVFSLGASVSADTNNSGWTFVAYLFATLPGVSKVGSYTGTNNTTIDVDCGFTTGARFVMIKRTDASSDWWVWDTTRGIVSGNDPYLLLNSTAAEVTGTDWIDPLSTGFQIPPFGLTNAAGGTYIFLAIA